MFSGDSNVLNIARTALMTAAMIFAVQVSAVAATPQQAESLPLVVKNPPRQEMSDGPKVTGVSPSPVIASDVQQRIIIKGSGFTRSSRVALSRGGQIEVWPSSEVEYLGSRELAVNVITGQLKAKWSVMVGNEDNQTSNLYGFTVAPEEVKAASKGPLPNARTSNVKEVSVAKASNVKSKSVPEAPLLNSEWYRGQPKNHYTIQLLASSSRMNLQMFARNNPQLKPLAVFATENNGANLYVLTMGSYSSRASADEAMKTLPSNLEPWIRSIENVQQVMVITEESSGTITEGEAGESLLIKDTAWVWTQNPEHYTIQLAAAGSKQAIDEAVKKSTLPGEAVILKMQRGSRLWYTWIHGSFANKAEADDAVGRLPKELKKAKPWVRRFANVQDELSQSSSKE